MQTLMDQAGICGSGQVCERHHCFQKREDEARWVDGWVGDSEASAPQSGLVYGSRYVKPEQGGGGNTTVALFCDKAAPTTRLSEYFDHNLCGTFNGAEVMS